MVHRQSGISNLQDLKNVTLALGNGPTFVEYMTLHLPLENVETVTYTGSIAPFLANERFAQQAYVFSEPYLAQQQGADPLNLMVSEIGFNPYASLLTTTSGTCAQDPELVTKLVRASLRGWKQYLADPQKTNELIDQLNPDMNPQALSYGVQQITRLCRPGGETSLPLGSMTRERWQTLIDQLVETKLVAPGSVAVEETFSNGFLANGQASDGEG
jgi:NitT/TauT family transport system substrate-binding protein